VRTASPATASAVRVLVRSASTPPSAVKTAIDALVLIDQADRVRAIWWLGVCSSRYVASTGLYRLMLMMTASSTAITVTSPTAPGRTNARPISHIARKLPAVRKTRRSPQRATDVWLPAWRPHARLEVQALGRPARAMKTHS